MTDNNDILKNILNEHLKREKPDPEITAAQMREAAEVILNSITPENLPALLVCVDQEGTHVSVHGTAASIMANLCILIAAVTRCFSRAEFDILKDQLQNSDFLWGLIEMAWEETREKQGAADDE